MYIEAECPKINSLYLCEAKLKYRTENNLDCIQTLISKQELLPSCNLASVILKNAAVEQLDEKHYTINFPYSTKVKISCQQETFRTLEGSYLAIIPFNCYIKTSQFTLANSNDHIKGFALEIMQAPTYDEDKSSNEIPLILNSVDLETLHSIDKKIIAQNPIDLKDNPDTSLYHTTIPLYLIISSAIALITVLGYRRQRSKQIQKNQSKESDNGPSKDYTEILELNQTNPSQIRIDHSNISSSPLRQISK